MKNTFKRTIFVLILCLVGTFAFASMQQFYQHDEEIKQLSELCRKGGISMPAYIYPVSGDTLNYFIENSNLESRLSFEDSNTLKGIVAKFSGENMLVKMSDDFAFDIDLSFAPTFLLYSQKIKKNDIKEKADDVDWIVNSNDIPDFILAEADLKLSDYAFGHFEYGLTPDITYYHRNKFEHNMMIMPISEKVLHNGISVNKERADNAPYHAYLSTGFSNMNLAIGRMRVSSSNGITGNLGAGDNFMYRDAAIFTLNAWPFTYQYMLNRFDSETSGNDCHTNISGAEVPWFTMHKATMNMFDNHFNIGVYEAVLSYSEFEPRVLSPFILMHNLLTYRNGNENNIFGFEADWTFDFGLDVHAQAVFDQIQLKGETADKPNAFGFLANVKYTTGIGKGNLTCFAEGVYTNPWLYLKAEGDDYASDPQKEKYYKYDLFVGNYFGTLWNSGADNSNVKSYQDSSFIGYKFGPNTMVADLGAVYRLPSNVASADLMVKVSGHKYDKALSGKHHTPYVEKGEKAEYLVQVRLQDTLSLFNGGLSVTGIAAYQNYTNYKNVKAKDHSDIQAMVSICCRPLKFIKTK